MLPKQVDSWKTTYKNMDPDEFLNQMSCASREEKWKGIISEGMVLSLKRMMERLLVFRPEARKEAILL